jgi:hypothetical protein
MRLVLEYGQPAAKKVPILSRPNNQLDAISLIVLIVRFRTLHVPFYTALVLFWYRSSWKEAAAWQLPHAMGTFWRRRPAIKYRSIRPI